MYYFAKRTFFVTFLLASIIPLKAYAEETACNTNGYLQFLDRHEVTCGNDHALQDWRGITCEDVSFQIGFDCGAVPPGGLVTAKSTACDEFQDESLQFLDRYKLSCSPGLMQDWKVNNEDCSNDGQFSFKYTCVDPPRANDDFNCYDYTTDCNEVVDKDLRYLDRHDVSCPAHQFLSDWVLSQAECSGRLQQVMYTCCDEPSTAPLTESPTGSPIGAYGDPHIKTWTGEQFDFHGICDLVLVSNPEFGNGAGLDIHIRSKKMRQWSYVDSAAVRIGTDILEVRGGEKRNFWINGIEGNGNTDTLSINEYPIQYYQMSKKSEKFIVDLGNGEGIVLKTWNSFVSVNVENPKKDKFVGSVGLMGRFPEGTKIGRENSIIEDINAFGQEWQVLSSEQNLFHDIEGPQHPQHCEIPSSKEMRRRLALSLVMVEDAEEACIGAGLEDKELCIFDVMATNDKSSAGAY